MKAEAVVLTRFGRDGLAIEERDLRDPGTGEVAVDIRAFSLNRRDLLLVDGIYNPKQKLPVVPGSDAAGVVRAVGPGVTAFKPGDRVIPGFFPDWSDGEPSMAQLLTSRGGPGGDGVMATTVICPAHGLVHCPDALSFEEAACLPCAGLTAWSAVGTLGAVKSGQTVVTQGTGGVSLFAIQFAKHCGATVIATTTSPAKREALLALGADHVIDLTGPTPWPEMVRRLCPQGVDVIVDVAGGKGLDAGIRLVRAGGTIALIGVLDAPQATITLPLVVMRQVRLQGVTVGSMAGLKSMTDAIAGPDGARLRPVIGARFPFRETRAAFDAMAANTVVGKIVVTL